jgi:hypothetical protein
MMRNASGHHREEDRWPLLPMAAPRGARELLWHAVVLMAVALPFALPAGWLVLGVVIAFAWFIKAGPVNLVRAALMYVATGFLVATIFAEPADFPITIMHVLTWSRAHQVGMPFTIALGYCFEVSLAMCTVALLMAFDRRSVNRAAVDLRVWQRQQTRRRQLLRQWHRSQDLPEVSQ